MKTIPEKIVMERADIDELAQSIHDRYKKEIHELVNAAVNRVIRDKEVNIYCGKCGKNILFENEPTVFGSKSKDKSMVYHMECWRQINEN